MYKTQPEDVPENFPNLDMQTKYVIMGISFTCDWMPAFSH